MSARKTGLHMSAYSLDGADLKANLQVFDFDIDATIVDARGIADEHALDTLTKRRTIHNFTILQESATSGKRATSLEIAVFTAGLTNLADDLQNWTITVSNGTADGSACRTIDEFPNAVGGRQMTMEGDLLIPSNATAIAMVTAALSDTLSDRIMTVEFEIAGVTWEAEMILNKCTPGAERNGLQTYRCMWSLHGTPTSPSDSSIYGVALLGDGLLTVIANTSVDTWTATGVITSLTVKGGNGQIVENQGTIALQGKPALS